jgi:hypothetical protein
MGIKVLPHQLVKIGPLETLLEGAFRKRKCLALPPLKGKCFAGGFATFCFHWALVAAHPSTKRFLSGTTFRLRRLQVGTCCSVVLSATLGGKASFF